MRRWIHVFLLLVLPLQFSWGVAATYCQHEASPRAAHFGHHTHQHRDSGVDATSKTSAKTSDPSDKTSKVNGHADGSVKLTKLSADGDCGTCHFGSAKPVHGACAVDVIPARMGVDAVAALSFKSRAPDHPERPNWLA
ncbi:cobalt-zinc-cadmium resistance protein [Roseateles amylovorans]|uniref:Cobalt-zinc-cadmium resistance protein n=1 Tax=Roseateles amylovorans TaxID=2978473 RepID=A0ABY6AYB9_9BURK|nr:cobalt-zinc-cadmium resistance protein [Roseateles amylovorans]UXH77394.1 cobalt-zinc-cadmium resistance protein [Roseateles amylovorans]